MTLSLFLLGHLQLAMAKGPILGPTSLKGQALLAYLAVEAGRPHHREALAGFLWPERPDRAALGSLRHDLFDLRQAIGDNAAALPFLLVTRETIQVNPEADYWLDVAAFEEKLSAAHSRPSTALEDFQSAVALYRGPFLEGLSLGDSPAFEEWQLLKREQFNREFLRALSSLAALYEERRVYEQALACVRRIIELEPWREEAHQQAMCLLTRAGRRSEALAQYRHCRDLIVRELGVEPAAEITALYESIRDGTFDSTLPAHPEEAVAPGRLREQCPLLRPPPAADARPVSPFVAREQELARLGNFLDDALTGQGGFALIAGEAGSGKTALLDEFARRAAQAYSGLIALRGRCNARAGAGDPYLPFREILQTLTADVESQRAGGALSAEQARRVWASLPAVGAALVEHGPDLIDRFVPGDGLLQRAEGFGAAPGAAPWQARLREIVRRAHEDTVPPPGPGLGAPAPQAGLFGQLTQVLHAVSLATPLLLAIDDLQWADEGTAALLFHLGRRLAGSRILLVCAYRSPVPGIGEGGPASGPDVWSVIRELQREWGDVLVDLDRADGRAFVEAYVDAEPNRLGADFRQALYAHTSGNPLFTVELVRSFEREGGLVQDEAGRWVAAPTLSWERCPPQVEAVIAGHMAGLPDEERTLLQAVSVQGEQFVAEVAARILGRSEEATVRQLSGALCARHRLVQAVSLDRLRGSGQRLSRYRFGHALLQRSAYRSLDVVERARLHEATGRALEALHGAEGVPPALAPALAEHYEAAGLPLEASGHLLAAGRWAAHLMACEEAIAHLERGLALLEGVPASRARLHLELGLWQAMVDPVLLLKGWRAPAFTRTLEHLSELTQRPDLQDDPQRLAGLCMLAATAAWSADAERGRRVGEQLLGLAQGGDRQPLMLAHWALGHSDWLRGELASTCEHLRQALALHDPEAGRRLPGVMGVDPAVMGRAMLGFALWLQGYADQARDSLHQAVAQAQATERPPTLAFAHLLAGMAQALLGRDVAASQGHAGAMRALGQAGRFYGGFVDVLAPQAQGSLAGADAGAEPGPGGGQAASGPPAQAVGSGLGMAALMLILVQDHVWASQPEIGLRAMDRALAWIERTGAHVMEAEVWRMRGELLRRQAAGTSRPAPVDEADSCFRRALGIAREQGAHWLELRAAMSLARLWQGQGRHDGARELLAGIYGWFTEGFDTPDLIEARALMDQLEDPT